MSADDAYAAGQSGARRLKDGDVQVDQVEAALIITLNRPEALNALTPSMQAEINDALEAARTDPSVRVIVFTGAGRAFCAGADARGLQASAEQGGADRLASGRTPYTPRQAKLYKPTICAVNGICVGAGLHFVADCDIVIASTTAQFIDTHVNVGQVTALEPIRLAERMSLGPLLRMVILGRGERLSAEQAKELHMISEVLPPDELMTRALELAELASRGSPRAIALSLQAVWETRDMTPTEAEARGYEILMEHRKHPDAREGPAAFLEKRPPIWTTD